VDGTAFVAVLKQAIANKLPSVTEEQVYITAVNADGAVVDYTVLAGSEEEAMSLSALISEIGEALFSSMEGTYGRATLINTPEVAKPKDDSKPLDIIIGVTAGVTVALLITIAVVVLLRKHRRAAVHGTPTGSDFTKPAAFNRVAVRPKSPETPA
jgi:hypothetical protein